MAGDGGGYYPQKISRLRRGLTWDFFGCLVGWVLLGWRIFFQLDWLTQSWTFIFPYLVSTFILIDLQMPKRVPSYVFALIFRKWSRLYKYYRMKRKIEDGHTTQGFPETGKTWVTYLTERNVDRVEHSIQCVGIAVLSTHFYLSTKTDICTLDDLATILIILWCAVMASSAAWSYEKRYHQYLRTLHTQSSYYPIMSFDSIEGCLVLGSHLSRVVWTVHFMDVLLLFEPWLVLGFWLTCILWNIGTHYAFERLGNVLLPELVRCPSFKKILCPTEAQFSLLRRLPSLKQLLYPDHFIFTSSVTLPCSSTDTSVGLWTKLFIALKDLLPMLFGQTILSWMSPHASHNLVRDFSYQCRIEDAHPLNINLGIFEAKSDCEVEWKAVVPKCFYPLDPIGIFLLVAYMLFLITYCLYAQKRIKRCVNFPADVAMRMYHRLRQDFPIADREVQFARLMLLLLTESESEFRRMLAKAKLVPIATVTGFTSLRAHKDVAEVEKKYNDLIGRELTTVKLKEMEGFRLALNSLREMSKEIEVPPSFLQVFKKFYESLGIRGKKLFSCRLLIMLNILDVKIEEALREISCRPETTTVQDGNNPEVGTADGCGATVRFRVHEAVAASPAKSKKKRRKSPKEKNSQVRTNSLGGVNISGSAIEVSNQYARLSDDNPGEDTEDTGRPLQSNQQK